MLRVLILNSSVTGVQSVSRRLVEAVVDRLSRDRSDAMTTVVRDLMVDPPPHLTPSTVAGIRGEAVTADERQTRTLSDQLIAELRTADVIVIGAPMYNFGIPSTLKAWFDHVVRPGVTFTYAGGGPKGLIEGKRVILVESRGGRYEGEMQALDFHDPYLRALLSFIGLTDIRVVRAEGVAMGPEALDNAMAAAMVAIDALVVESAATAS